jgi:hypothetical protein
MTEQIGLALETSRKDPLGAKQDLRTLLNEDPRQFVGAAAKILSQPEKTGSQPLIEVLARGASVVQQLCDPELLDKDTSIELAQRIAAIEPRLDTKLMSLLPGRGSESCDEAQALVAERALEILEAISAGMRVVPMLAHMMGHPNPRLRAKVSKLIGRKIRNVRAAEERLNEIDPRVRANAVESLWGEKAPWAARLLWKATHDVNNRVAGNALFGLYELRDEKTIPLIMVMADHIKPLFRSTAAWTMGQTGDPQFLPALEKLSRDLYATVRKTASKAIERISKREVVEENSEDSTSQNR